MGGYKELQRHPFFEGIVWETLTDTEPPKILPYLPSNTKDGESLKSDYDVGYVYGAVCCHTQSYTTTHCIHGCSHVHTYVHTLTHTHTHTHTHILISEYTYLLYVTHVHTYVYQSINQSINHY